MASVKDHEPKGALKTFIKSVGLLIFILGAAAVLVCVFGMMRQIFVRGFDWRILVAGPLIFGMYGVVSFIGWRMFRNWNDATIGEYAALQSLFTAIAIGGMLSLFWTGWGNLVGLLVFLILLRVLKPFLLRLLGFHGKCSKTHIETDRAWETAGTPWLNDSGHTMR